MSHTADPKTPWQRVYAKFGMSQSAFARALKRHRSKISRALRHDKGLLNGKDQELVIRVAKELGVDLRPDDMMPTINNWPTTDPDLAK